MKAYQKISMLLTVVLAVAGIACNALEFLHAEKAYSMYVIHIVTYLSILHYATFGYKKPHGNLLKHLFSFIIIDIIVAMNVTYQNEEYIGLNIVLLCIALVAYSAGRLNRIEQNKAIMLVVFVLFAVVIYLHFSAIGDHHFVEAYVCITPYLTWALVSATYLIRFKEHKFIGILEEDDSKALSTAEMEKVSKVWMHL